MWMWYKPFKRDVFVANVETVPALSMRCFQGAWVYFYGGEKFGWVSDRLLQFEPPRKH